MADVDDESEMYGPGTSNELAAKDHIHQRLRARSVQVAMIHHEVEASHVTPRCGFIRRGKYRRFKKILYNHEDNTFCRRTLGSWLAIIGYYLIFVIIVVALFGGLVYGCIKFLIWHQNKPWMSKKHLIEDNIPGISYLPNIDSLSDSVIWYKVNNGDLEGRAEQYVNQIDTYFKKLEETCAKSTKGTCNFNRSSLGPCGEHNFGYDSSSPCIVIRLNKLEDWIPKDYEDDNIPKNVPEKLKAQMIETAEIRLWIDCIGLDEYDTDHLNTIHYYPMNGYPVSGFPYTEANQAYYVSPLVVLHLQNIDNGRVLCLKCNLYAANYVQEQQYELFTKTFIYIEGTEHS